MELIRTDWLLFDFLGLRLYGSCTHGALVFINQTCSEVDNKLDELPQISNVLYKIGCLWLQIHPMGLCNDGDFEESMSTQKDYGWVVVVKLELPQLDPDPCMSIYNKVWWHLHKTVASYLSVCLGDQTYAHKTYRYSQQHICLKNKT